MTIAGSSSYKNNGLFVLETVGSNITQINSTNNYYGIFMHHSLRSIIMNSTFVTNNYGAYLNNCTNNTIYNNFIGYNTNSDGYDNRTNFWNTTNTSGTNIVNGPNMGGNFWVNYTGFDTNSDGIGDSPPNYSIAGGSNYDYLPLVSKANASLFVENITIEGMTGTEYVIKNATIYNYGPGKMHNITLYVYINPLSITFTNLTACSNLTANTGCNITLNITVPYNNKGSYITSWRINWTGDDSTVETKSYTHTIKILGKPTLNASIHFIKLNESLSPYNISYVNVTNYGNDNLDRVNVTFLNGTIPGEWITLTSSDSSWNDTSKS